MAPLPEKINGAQSALPVCGPPQVAREQVKGSGSASVEGWVLAPERTVLCILPSLLQFLLRGGPATVPMASAAWLGLEAGS